MRGWSDEQANDEQVFTGGAVSRGPHGFDYQTEHPSQWAAMNSIAGKIGCTGETLRSWVRRAERDQGLRGGPTTEDGARVKALERENRELCQATEILRKASAFLPRRSSTAR